MPNCRLLIKRIVGSPCYLIFQELHHYIFTFSHKDSDSIIKYQIIYWKEYQTYLVTPWQYAMGFFYFTFSASEEFITIKHSSFVDILLNLWIKSCVSCLPDSFIQYGMSTSPILRRSLLAKRWGRSVHSVCTAIKILSEKGYICYQSFNDGLMIRLNGYIHTMYQLSIDPFSLNAQPYPVQIPFLNFHGDRPQMNEIIQETLHFLSLQNPCSNCSRSSFYVTQKDLTQIKGSYSLSINCAGQERYSYSIAVKTTGKECWRGKRRWKKYDD